MLYLSVSQRTAYKRCRYQWSWRYKLGLEAKTAAPALRFGTLCHLALEKRYPKGKKRGVHPAVTFEQEYERELVEQMKMGFRDEDGKWQDAGELGVAMMNGYVNTYGDDEEWEVIATEQHFEQPVILDGKQVALAIGVLDGIWRNRVTKKLIIVDHKSAAKISTRHLSMDDQAGQYWTFGVDWMRDKGLLLPGDSLDTIMFNFLRKQMPDPRPTDEKGRCLNKDGSVSEKQPSPLFLRHNTYRSETERDMIRYRAAQEAVEITMARTGKLAITKSPSQFNCATCPVPDICELHEVGQDWKAMARATMKKKSQRPKVEAVEYEHAH